MTEKELATEINNWFNNKYNDLVPNFWNRNPVAQAIKSNLKQKKHWKGLKRGNPSKGAKKKKYNKAVKEGYMGEFEG